MQRARKAFDGYRDAQVFALIRRRSAAWASRAASTCSCKHQRHEPEQFEQARDRLCNGLRQPDLQQVRLAELPDVSTLKVNVNQERISALGLNTGDVNNTLATAWGGRYVNDFIDRGRVKRVYVQGDAPYRSKPEDIDHGRCATTRARWCHSPSPRPVGRRRRSAFRAFSAFSLTSFRGACARQKQRRCDASDSEARRSDPGVGVAWSGQSYEEKLSSGQAPFLYAISLLVVFLCLAALYESWSIPFAVILVIPLGLVGAIRGHAPGLQNDVYLQIGLLTTMGLPPRIRS